jgi:hypothetical protein
MNIINKTSAALAILTIVAVSLAFENLANKKEERPRTSEADTKGFSVIELFTSEGCSSCPPADQLVAQVQKEDSAKQIYILAYHVDYWDRQGWKDTFSDAAYSERQSSYARWLDLSTIYTPQIIINGKTGFVGSDRSTLNREIAASLKEIPKGVLTLNGTVVNDQISVGYQTNVPIDQSYLVISLIQKFGQSKVSAGENSGRILNHVQIVRKLAIQTLQSGQGKVSLALPKDYHSSGWELIGLVQNKKNGLMLAAARSELIKR